jgi:S-adenosylmethionine synthetase
MIPFNTINPGKFVMEDLTEILDLTGRKIIEHYGGKTHGGGAFSGKIK